jgi:hypothetical protein
VQIGAYFHHPPLFLGGFVEPRPLKSRHDRHTNLPRAATTRTKPSMHCPICQHGQHFVLKTESVEQVIRRRRQCARCGHRWNTYEGMADLGDELVRLKQALSKVAELVQVGVR